MNEPKYALTDVGRDPIRSHEAVDAAYTAGVIDDDEIEILNTSAKGLDPVNFEQAIRLLVRVGILRKVK